MPLRSASESSVSGIVVRMFSTRCRIVALGTSSRCRSFHLYVPMAVARRATFLASEKHFETRLRSSSEILESETKCFDLVKESIPVLLESSHKGQLGRIGVVGGCQEYTGAPYFAAISALRTGADLSHVFCTCDSAVVIKSYSPELIVHPILDKKTAVQEMSEWLPRLHCLVIGPGLGRNPTIIENVKGLIEKAKELGKFLIIDADGLFLVTSYPDIIKNYSKTILTPNAVEFTRLYNAVFGREPDLAADTSLLVTQICQEMGGITVCRKGAKDVIADGKNVVVCSTEGSCRRCGGQGDVLSGAMGTFSHWADMYLKKKLKDDRAPTFGRTLLAAYGACTLTRTCNRLAFTKYNRNMITTDMITEIHEAFEELYPQKCRQESAI